MQTPTYFEKLYGNYDPLKTLKQTMTEIRKQSKEHADAAKAPISR